MKNKHTLTSQEEAFNELTRIKRSRLTCLIKLLCSLQLLKRLLSRI